MSTKTRMKYEEAEDRLYVETIQDCEPILDNVKQHREVATGKPTPGLGYFVGRIPSVIVEKYCKEFGITFNQFCEDNTHVKRIVNDPDYSRFRVWEGQV